MTFDGKPGTRFVVTLPLAEAGRDARSRRAHPARRRRGSPGRGPRVNLQRKGYEVDLAGDGRTGWPRPRRGATTSSCSTSACPRSTASRSASACARRQLHADPDAHRAHPAGRCGLRPEARRRRLRHQAVRPRRAAGADRGPAAPAGMVAAGARGQRRRSTGRDAAAGTGRPDSARGRRRGGASAGRRCDGPRRAARRVRAVPGSTSAPGRRARGRAWSSSRARSWRS